MSLLPLAIQGQGIEWHREMTCDRSNLTANFSVFIYPTIVDSAQLEVEWFDSSKKFPNLLHEYVSAIGDNQLS